LRLHPILGEPHPRSNSNGVKAVQGGALEGNYPWLWPMEIGFRTGAAAVGAGRKLPKSAD
jgi:hypothetical protein